MIVTSSYPEFHCRDLELNEMLCVPATLLRSTEGSTGTLLYGDTMSKFILAQGSVLLNLFFSFYSGDSQKTV